jgi:hypothetical protein
MNVKRGLQVSSLVPVFNVHPTYLHLWLSGILDTVSVFCGTWEELEKVSGREFRTQPSRSVDFGGLPTYPILYSHFYIDLHDCQAEGRRFETRPRRFLQSAPYLHLWPLCARGTWGEISNSEKGLIKTKFGEKFKEGHSNV